MPVIKRKLDRSGSGRLIPPRHYPRPMRFVGIGIIVMIAVIFFLYKIIVR